MSDLPELRRSVMTVTTEMTHDEVLEVRERMLFAKSALRDLEKDLNESLIKWMNANGDLRINDDKHLYIGHDKRVKCNDVAVTLEALLVATGGDFGAVTDCMSAGAFKHGACRKPLGDAWGEHFNETIVDRVKVKEADARFTKSKQKETTL